MEIKQLEEKIILLEEVIKELLLDKERQKHVINKLYKKISELEKNVYISGENHEGLKQSVYKHLDKALYDEI